jgi:glycosyltransferase involved in cell wall biosynthesis
MSRLRLLVETHEYSLTGAPIALLNLVAGLASTMDVVVAGSMDGALRQHFLARQINAVIVPELDKDVNVSRSLLLSFDALLANTLVSFMSIHAAHQLNKPSVWYVHEGQIANSLSKTRGPGLSAAFPLASRIVVPSEFSRRFFAAARPGIEVVPYGVEHRESAPPERTASHVKVLQLGSIEPRKGQDITCAAARLLKDQPVKFDIVGLVLVSEYHRQLRSSCADLPNVRFFPEVDSSQTSALIAGCDVLVVPSRDEVTPMVILEAMALGKTVVAAAVGGIPEMIVDGRSGFLFEPENAAALARIIARHANDAPTRQSIGAAAQNFVRAERTLDQYRERFAAIISATIPLRK